MILTSINKHNKTYNIYLLKRGPAQKITTTESPEMPDKI